MAWFVAALPYILGATAVGSTYMQVEANKENKRSAKLQQAQADIQMARERRKMVREDRIRRAALANAGQVTGTSRSSSAMSAGQGLTTQFSSNMSESFGMQALSQQISRSNQRSANYQNYANIFNNLQSTAMMYGQV